MATTASGRKRRTRVTSAAGQVAAAKAAADLREPPAYAQFTDAHREVWFELMRSRSRLEWESETDLRLAVRLTENTIDLATMRDALRKAGFVQYDEKTGRDAAHPLVNAATKTANEIRADYRALGLTARERGQQGTHYVGQRKAERVAREQAAESETEEDDLLA